MGPMDVILGVFVALLAMTAQAVVSGYAFYAALAWLGLILICYPNAPARSYPTAEQVTEGVDLKGKVCLVTGSTSGIGVDTVRVLALRGATVYMAARNPKKLEETKARIEKELQAGSEGDTAATAQKVGTLHVLTCDLNDLRSVKECSSAFLKREDKLHVMINNAGIMAVPERKSTQQGLEQQVGVCHVGHFYLTRLLMPALIKAAPSRVVVLSSSAHVRHGLGALLERTNDRLETVPYDPWVAYGNAKACNMLHARGLHDRFYETEGVAAFSVMPGGIFTGLQDNVDWYTSLKYRVVAPFFFKTTSQGAATSLVCATRADPDDCGGEYFDNCEVSRRSLAKVLEQAQRSTDGKDEGARAENDTDAHPATVLWTKTEKLLADLKFT